MTAGPDEMPAGAFDLLHLLVTGGPVVVDDPDDARLSPPNVTDLIDSGFAEIVVGRDRSMLRATFTGRARLAAWRAGEEKRTRGWPRGLGPK